jgi:hypothetical protein
MEWELLLYRSEALYFCTLYHCVQKQEGTKVPSLSTGGLASTECTEQGVGGKCSSLGQLWQAELAAAYLLLNPCFGAKSFITMDSMLLLPRKLLQEV